MKIKPIQVRTLLSERGLTVKGLATMAGIQEETVYAALRNPKRSTNWDTAYRLSQALGVEMENIFYMREYVRVEDSIDLAALQS